jgi:uncharacterized protein
MLSVVLDTNIVLASITGTSEYHSIIDHLLNGKFTLIVSNDILLEYEEKLSETFFPETASFFIDALLSLPNVKRVHPLFLSHLLNDTDDNKFLDAYYTGQGNFIVTNDKDFEVLKSIKQPPHHLLKIHEFIKLLEQ